MAEEKSSEFKEFMLKEGQFWDALKHGVAVGVKEFSKKRKELATKSEMQTMTKKILDADGKELESLLKQIVEKGYTVKGGAVQKPSLKARSTDWLLECTRTKAE